jgi:hypothetical protein
MSISIRDTSRLQFADLLIVDSVEFWDTLALPDAVARPDDIIHVVASSDRIDLLADQYYQNVSLWWVIAWANDLNILPTDLKENARIRIPSKDFVINELIRKAIRRA